MIEPGHFVNGEQIKIKCIAEVGSHKYEIERKVTKAYVNNLRLSSDINAAARSIRAGLLAPLLMAILALVLLTTWPIGFLAWVGLLE